MARRRMPTEQRYRRRIARQCGLRAIVYMGHAIRSNPNYSPLVFEHHLEAAMREARAAWRNAEMSETVQD